MVIRAVKRESQVEQNRIESFGFVIGVCLSALLGAFFAISTLADSSGASEIRLDGRVNPNHDPVASLIRLPGIGVSRATAIVAYREDTAHRGGTAFKNCKDLQNVKGIGPKTAENIERWLTFE